MTSETPGGDPLAHFAETLRADHRAAAKKAKTTLILVIVLNLFIIGYMSWIRSSLRQLDAAELTGIAGRAAEAKMAELEVQLGDYLVDAAPGLTDRAREVLLQAPLAIRERMESVLEMRIEEELVALEESLDARFEAVFNERVADLRREYPQGPDQARLDAFMRDLILECRGRTETLLDVTYEGFAGELRKLDDKFHRLKNAGDLTEKELIEKEIIETWVILVEKHEFAIPE
jgi:hypothetical protein